MATKKKATRKPAKKTAAKRKPNAAFMKPMTPSAALGVIGFMNAAFGLRLAADFFAGFRVAFFFVAILSTPFSRFGSVI